MKLKNVLIVVNDIEESKRFYHDLFGLNVVLDGDGNVMLSEGLVLQDKKLWEEVIGKESFAKNNSFELYFEENDMDAFLEKLAKLYPDTKFINETANNVWGRRMVRFYDLDGHVIEVSQL